LKHVVSVSLGSSIRDHKVQTEILGEQFTIERIGTDGNMEKAIALVKELDGQIDAFGMGGIQVDFIAGSRKYPIKDAIPFARAAKITPMVDGTGLKDSLERRYIKYLAQEHNYNFKGKKVLMTAAVDRYGMTEALIEEGADLTIGDLLFALNIPLPLHSMKSLDYLARVAGPIVGKIPFHMLYPIGKEQDKKTPKYPKYFQQADIIAGDFHQIHCFMPENMEGKDIITNTVTAADKQDLKKRGIRTLYTTTPQLEGRSFGTNVIEAVLIAASGKKPGTISRQEYYDLLDKAAINGTIEKLN